MIEGMRRVGSVTNEQHEIKLPKLRSLQNSFVLPFRTWCTNAFTDSDGLSHLSRRDLCESTQELLKTLRCGDTTCSSKYHAGIYGSTTRSRHFHSERREGVASHPHMQHLDLPKDKRRLPNRWYYSDRDTRTWWEMWAVQLIRMRSSDSHSVSTDPGRSDSQLALVLGHEIIRCWSDGGDVY